MSSSAKSIVTVSYLTEQQQCHVRFDRAFRRLCDAADLRVDALRTAMIFPRDRLESVEMLSSRSRADVVASVLEFFMARPFEPVFVVPVVDCEVLAV